MIDTATTAMRCACEIGECGAGAGGDARLCALGARAHGDGSAAAAETATPAQPRLRVCVPAACACAVCASVRRSKAASSRLVSGVLDEIGPPRDLKQQQQQQQSREWAAAPTGAPRFGRCRQRGSLALTESLVKRTARGWQGRFKPQISTISSRPQRPGWPSGRHNGHH
jgi:hypothetical protein